MKEDDVWKWIVLVGIVAAAVVVVMGIGTRCSPSKQYEIQRLENPPWPCKAAGAGPASVLVEVDEETEVSICPLDPEKCDVRTLEAGSWVIYLDIPENEIWHVRIK